MTESDIATYITQEVAYYPSLTVDFYMVDTLISQENKQTPTTKIIDQELNVFFSHQMGSISDLHIYEYDITTD